MKSVAIVALLLCGVVLRMQGWQYFARQQKEPGLLLVIGGTAVTLCIVLVALATPDT